MLALEYIKILQNFFGDIHKTTEVEEKSCLEIKHRHFTQLNTKFQHSDMNTISTIKKEIT